MSEKDPLADTIQEIVESSTEISDSINLAENFTDLQNQIEELKKELSEPREEVREGYSIYLKTKLAILKAAFETTKGIRSELRKEFNSETKFLIHSMGSKYSPARLIEAHVKKAEQINQTSEKFEKEVVKATEEKLQEIEVVLKEK